MVDHFCALFNELLAAFRKSYSCQTLLIKFIEDLKFALDKGHKIGTVYMHLSKAFDCLPHGLLLAKLHAYGLSEAACETMFDYLKDRKQRVKILNHRSSWKELTKGVPQGSILGPFLFNVFINDLFLFIENCKLYNYADDNSLMYSSPDLNCIFTNLQIDCKNAIDWFTVNGMKANPSKFQFMVISSERIEQKCLDIGNGITLQSEPSVKVLGVTIDDRLQFSEHISACCSKAARQLNALSRISRQINLKSKSIIYNSFIASNFNYCPLVWHFCGTANSNKIEKLQERSLRILYNDFDSPIQNLIDKSGQGTLLSNRMKYFILEVFKSIRKLNAPCLHDLFVHNEVPYNLRTPKLEQTIRRTTNYGLRTFSYLGSKLWNEFLSDFNYTCDTDISELRNFLKIWEGPSLDPSYRNYVWTFVGWSIFLFAVVDILGWYFYFWYFYFYTLWPYLTWFCFSPWVFYVHNDLALYIFALPQSRILAYWLMLSDVKTTINKVYLILSYLCMWHGPKVTAVALTHKHFLVCTIKWKPLIQSLQSLIVYPPSHAYNLIRFWKNSIGNFFGRTFLKIQMCLFKVKHSFGHISRMVVPTDVKRKGSALVGYWWVTW